MSDTAPPPGRSQEPLVGVVGVCAAGKSTLISAMKIRGMRAKHIAQEHSYVKDMWKRLTNPDLLVFLDASYAVTLARRQYDWSEADWAEQQHRLRHAREHADLIIDTDALTPRQILEQVLDFVNSFNKA